MVYVQSFFSTPSSSYIVILLLGHQIAFLSYPEKSKPLTPTKSHLVFTEGLSKIQMANRYLEFLNMLLCQE